jgi:hypothetical protein
MVAVSATEPRHPLPAAATAAPWIADLLADLPAAPSAAVARARELLAQQPLPSRRQEDWRFTDLAPLTTIAPRPLDPAEQASSAPAAPLGPVAESGRLRLLLDGLRDPLDGLTLPPGLHRLEGEALQAALGRSLAAQGLEADWPVLLNTALAPRVLALRVSAAVAPLLELVNDVGTGQGVEALRLLLLLEDGASLEVLQVQRAAAASATSLLLEAELGRGARLRHGLLAQGHGAASLLAQLVVSQSPGSELDLVSALSGWGLVRLEPRVLQDEGQAATRLRGLQRVDGRQIADTHSQVAFAGPEGRLDQLHKVVADGAGRSVFNGAVRVPRAAQRTDAAQLSRSLLLSDRARIDTKPELEIVADDVKCAHGATVSRLQDDELFYLQSRGIAAAQAARLLLRGYCDEVLAELPGGAAGWQPLERLMGEDPTP